MAAYTFSVDTVDGINKTTTGVTVDSVAISAGGDARRQWTVEVSNWGTVDIWVIGGAFGNNTVANVATPTAQGDSCHRIPAGTAYIFRTDQAAYFILKVLASSAVNTDYSVEIIEERQEVFA